MSHELKVYSHVLGKTVDELLDMNGVLCDDAQYLLELLNRDYKNQAIRRSFVRACWAYIEATVHGVKETTLCASTLGSVDLPTKDHIFLYGGTFLVSLDGSTVFKLLRCDTEKTIKHTLRIAAECFDVGWSPDFTHKGWRMLRMSLQLRHRLVHPQSVAKLDVSDQEADEHQEAFIWFSKLYTNLINDIHNRFVPVTDKSK
ncbi:hypothetical protein GIW70_12945 [Pseudomonas syringae]|nr:hypothetical protein [Pseudomonas syringae]MCF5069092.1 hypothetical protein [Pseudomonas syringae]